MLDCASDVLGYDVAALMASAPAEKLNDTRYAQPATCALSVGIASALQARGVQPAGRARILAGAGQRPGGFAACSPTRKRFRFVAERARLMARGRCRAIRA